MIVRISVVALVSALGFGPCATSNSGGTDGDASVASACSASMAPGSSSLQSCTPSDLRACAGASCGLAALPTGLPCSSGATCEMGIDPCADWREAAAYGGDVRDEYVCACVSGAWDCGLCERDSADCACVEAGTCSRDGG
jgi:hypothetical protein